MKSNEYCECYDDISDIHELFDMIKGKNGVDIRENCIFRGLAKDTYALEPVSTRNHGEELNKFISNIEMLPLPENPSDPNSVALVLNKDFKISSNDDIELNNTLNLLQKWKELYVLMKFINAADRNGLKINVDERIRRLIDLENYKLFFKHWPEQMLWENIALAQHYGTPTRFLDWSYDYKVSLYFAVKDILDEDNEKSDGVLWAFNYKLFNKVTHLESKEQFKLQFYRPEYSSNPNLNAQKGIFAFFVNKIYEDSFGEFHQVIINQFKENDQTDNEIMEGVLFNRVHGLKTLDIPNGEKVFYKFIIPYDLKKDVLKELIKENYFTDKLFPGYQGVSESIRHKVILDEFKY